MSEASENQDPEAVLKQIIAIAAMKLGAGASRDAVKAELIEHGLSNEAAEKTVEIAAQLVATSGDVDSDAEPVVRTWRNNDTQDDGSSNVIWGVVLLLGGGMVTMFSYGGAVQAGGGTYILAWGPMAYGAVLLIIGLMRGR